MDDIFVNFASPESANMFRSSEPQNINFNVEYEKFSLNFKVCRKMINLPLVLNGVFKNFG